MEIDDNTVQEKKMDQGHMRYMRLHAIVEEINSKPVSRTAEWYTEHSHLLNLYDSHFKSGFSELHPEITNPTFRSNCKMMDTLINKLMREYDNYHWFSLYDYLQFNKIAISVVDEVYASEEKMDAEEEEMSSLFSTMKV